MSVDVSPFEVASGSGVAALRARGRLGVTVERIAGQSVATQIDEEGPLRLRFPRVGAGDALEGIIVNTGGGIAGGDRHEFEIAAGEGTRVALTSQAAEKIYRSDGADATIAVQLRAAAGASLVWVPQESILFDRARVVRTIDAEVAADATLTICESVVFGRTAMNETVVHGMLKDRWRMRRDGKLIFADVLTLDGAIAEMLARPAIAAGACTVATLLQISPDAEAKIEAVRAALHGGEAGASAFDGMLVIRILAHDSLSLRAAILGSLAALGAGPPRAFTL
jgi:urease accessory protein